MSRPLLARRGCVDSPPMAMATGTPPSKHSAAPERSLNQRMDALARARPHLHRARPAQARSSRPAGSRSHTLLLNPRSTSRPPRSSTPMLAVPQVRARQGQARSSHCRIAPSKTIGGLSERQRSELVSLLARRFRAAWRGDLRHNRSLRRRQGHSDPRSSWSASPRRSSSPARRRRRAARPGECDGVHYHFLSPAEFELLRVARGGFVEHADYAGRRCHGHACAASSTPAGGAGVPVVLEIEVQGALQVRAAMPEALQVFIAPPPSLEALRTRLIGGGTDDHDEVERRLRVAEHELDAAPRVRARRPSTTASKTRSRSSPRSSPASSTEGSRRGRSSRAFRRDAGRLKRMFRCGARRAYARAGAHAAEGARSQNRPLQSEGQPREGAGTNVISLASTSCSRTSIPTTPVSPPPPSARARSTATTTTSARAHSTSSRRRWSTPPPRTTSRSRLKR